MRRSNCGWGPVSAARTAAIESPDAAAWLTLWVSTSSTANHATTTAATPASAIRVSIGTF